MFIGVTSHFFLVFEGLAVFVLVGSHTILTKNEFGQVKREAVGVFECKDIHAAYFGFAGFACIGNQFVEQGNTFIQRTQECFLFGFNNRRNLLFLFHQFGVCFSHVGDELRHQFIEERLALVKERIAIAHSTT